MGEGEQGRGLGASLRRLLETALGAFQNRIELAAVELQEEKNWMMRALLWTAALIFFGLLAIVIITSTVVLLSPAEARPYVLIGFCVLYTALAVFAGFGLKKRLNNRQAPFSATVAEIKKDIEWLKKRE